MARTSRRNSLSWFGVFALVAVVAFVGIFLLSVASDQSDVRRDIGSSLVGSAIVGLVFAMVGEILAAQARRRDFLFTLSQTQDLTGIDLTGEDLRGLYFVGKNLTRANMSRADLSSANFAGANLSQANLSQARLRQTIFADATLSGAYLDRVSAIGTVFMDASMDSTVLMLADLRGTFFDRADLTGALLVGVRCRQSRLVSSVRMRLQWWNPKFRWNLRKSFGITQMLNEQPQSWDQFRMSVRQGLRAATGAMSVSFRDATLSEADLRSADLVATQFDGVSIDRPWYDRRTRWPDGFTPPAVNQDARPSPPVPWRELVRPTPQPSRSPSQPSVTPEPPATG